MRTRSHRVEVRLSDAEYTKFMNAVARAGITQQCFLRHLIGGYSPREKPSPDYFSMTEQLRIVGGSLGRIACAIHASGAFDPKEYEADIALYRQTLRDITQAVVGPEKVKT